MVQDQHLPSLLSLPRMGLPLKASQPIELSTYVSVSSPVHSIWMITCTAQGLAISQLVHILVPGILAPTSKVTKLLIEIRIKFLYTKLIEIENNGEKHLRINSSHSRLPSGAHFPSVLTVFKTALVSIIFILELSVLHKSCLELNFQAKGIISRFPCTPVFLRSRTSDFQY